MRMVQVRWDALHLSRRQKAAALMVTGAVLWLNVPWALRAQALLLGALIIRCNLKPAEACTLPDTLFMDLRDHQWPTLPGGAKSRLPCCPGERHHLARGALRPQRKEARQATLHRGRGHAAAPQQHRCSPV